MSEPVDDDEPPEDWGDDVLRIRCRSAKHPGVQPHVATFARLRGIGDGSWKLRESSQRYPQDVEETWLLGTLALSPKEPRPEGARVKYKLPCRVCNANVCITDADLQPILTGAHPSRLFLDDLRPKQ